MSLILDALRRAEAERRRDGGVDLHGLPESGAPRRSGLHPAWLAVAAAAAFLLAMLLWPRAQPPAPASAETRQPPPTAPRATATDQPQSVAATARVARPVADLDELLPPPPPPRPRTATAQPAPAAAETAPSDAADAQRPPTAGKPTAPQDASAATAENGASRPPATAEPAPSPPASDGTASTDATAAPAPQPEIPEPALPPELLVEDLDATPLPEMPPDYRAAFPRLSIDVHVWDEDPARRFVLIDLKRYREGMTTSHGLQIVRILPSGIVFAYRGRTVYYPLQR